MELRDGPVGSDRESLRLAKSVLAGGMAGLLSGGFKFPNGPRTSGAKRQRAGARNCAGTIS